MLKQQYPSYVCLFKFCSLKSDKKCQHKSVIFRQNMVCDFSRNTERDCWLEVWNFLIAYSIPDRPILVCKFYLQIEWWKTQTEEDQFIRIQSFLFSFDPFLLPLTFELAQCAQNCIIKNWKTTIRYSTKQIIDWNLLAKLNTFMKSSPIASLWGIF